MSVPRSDAADVWRHMHEAPREPQDGVPVAVTLYCPAAEFATNEHGRPVLDTVKHRECVGHWDAAHEHWVDQATGARVFPSQWKPAEGAAT